MNIKRVIIFTLLFSFLSSALFAQITRIRNPMTNPGTDDSGDIALNKVVTLVGDMLVDECGPTDLPVGVVTVVESEAGAPDRYLVSNNGIVKVIIASGESILLGERVVPAADGMIQPLASNPAGYVLGLALSDGIAGESINVMIDFNVEGGAADQTDAEVPVTDIASFSGISLEPAATVHDALIEFDTYISSGAGLQEAYEVGQTIDTDSDGPVSITSTSSNALLVTSGSTDIANPALRVTNSDASGTAIWSDGNFRVKGDGRIYSDSNINLQLDYGGSAASSNNFYIRDHGDSPLFQVSENGDVSVPSTGNYVVGAGVGAWSIKSLSDVVGATDMPITFPDLGDPGYNMILPGRNLIEVIAVIDSAIGDPSTIMHGLQDGYEDGNTMAVTDGRPVRVEQDDVGLDIDDFTVLDIDGNITLDGDIEMKDIGGEGFFGTIRMGDISAHHVYTLPNLTGEVSVLGQTINDSEIDFGTGVGQVDAGDLVFAPSDGADWPDPDPSDAGTALDALADRITAVESGGMEVLSNGNGISAFSYDGSSAASVAVSAGTGITVDGSGVHVQYGTAAGTAVQGNQTATITAGDGLAGGITADALGDGFTASLSVNAANGVTAASGSVEIDETWFSGDIAVASDGVVTVQNNAIDDSDIDFGTGSDQVDAADIPYVNTASGLTAIQVQSAIDEVDGRIDAIEGGSLDQTLSEVLSAGNSTEGTAITNGAGSEVTIDSDLRVTGNNIYGDAVGDGQFIINNNGNIRMRIDSDDDGSAQFEVRGTSGNALILTEGGNLTTTGNATIGGNVKLNGSSALEIYGPDDNALDIISDTGIDVYIDNDEDVGANSRFEVKTINSGVDDVVFTVKENKDIQVYGMILDESGTSGTFGQILGAGGSGTLEWVDREDIASDDQDLSFAVTAPPISLNITDGTGVRFAEGVNVDLTTDGTDLTIGVPTEVDLVAGTALTGGQDNILVGAVDGDVTIGLADGTAADAALIWNAGTSTWENVSTTAWDKDASDDFTTSDETDPIFSAVDTEAELESHITDVSNIYTNTDGNLNDDDLSDNSVGDLSDVTLSSAAQGHLLYNNGSAWVNLAPGTSGQILSTGGTGANPSWADDQGAITLDDLTDVTLGTLTSDDVLAYDGSSWVNQELAASGISASDIANWNTAYSWGNHDDAGYDPTVGNEFNAISDGGIPISASIGSSTIRFNATGGASVTVTNPGGVPTVTIDATGAGTDIDNYVDDITFNTTTGDLTLGRTGTLLDLTESLDGRYAVASELADNDNTTTPVDWDDLTDIPADIADGDANTTYTAGTGLTLAGTEFSHSAHSGDVSGATSLTVTGLQGRTLASTAPSDGQVISWNASGSQWEPSAVAAGTVTSIATENGITGGPITGSGTIGLTGNALGLHNLSSNGLVVRTGAGAITSRSIAVSGNGINVSNADGVSGNPTLSLDIGTGAAQVAAGNHNHDSSYDNYNYWTVSDGSSTSNISSTGTLTFGITGGGTVSVGAGTIDFDVSGVGDQWGVQRVVSDATLDGNGDETALKIAQQGASTGQVLKWNGSTWAPSNDNIDEDEDDEDQELMINSSSRDDVISIDNGSDHLTPISSVTIDDDDEQTLTFTGAASPYTLDISNSTSDVQFTAGANVSISRSGNNLTFSASTDGTGITSINGLTAAALNINGGTALSVSTSSPTITLNHDVIWSSAGSDNSNGVVIQDVNLDGLGHIDGLSTVDLDTRYYTETEINGNYVPYTGATGDVDLGSNDLFVDVVHANKVDPTMKIDGQLYVTWMAENIGFWIDIISEGQLTDGEFRVDLDQQEEGSDLWIFWRSVAEGTVIPLVTAQDPAILMARMEGTELVVRSISGQENARFSFRLSGKRLDEAQKTPDEINRPSEPHDHYIDLDVYDRKGNLK